MHPAKDAPATPSGIYIHTLNPPECAVAPIAPFIGDHQLLGQLMITYEWSDWRNGAFWWIQSVYVDSAWRRRGVFRRMHETVMATAKTSPNVCGVRLYVEVSNGAAQAVYRKVGLTPSSYAIFETDFVLARTRI